MSAGQEQAGLRHQLCEALRRIRQQKAMATIVEADTAAQAVPGWGVLLEDLRPGYVPPRLPLWPVRSRAPGGPVPPYQRAQWFRSVNDE